MIHQRSDSSWKSPVAHVANPDNRLDELLWNIRQPLAHDARRRHEFLIASLGDLYPPVRQTAASLLAGEPTLSEAHRAELGALVSLSLVPEHHAHHDTSERPPYLPPPSKETGLAALAALKRTESDDFLSTCALLSQHPDADVRYQSLLNLFEVESLDAKLDLCTLLRPRIEDSDEEVAIIAAQFASERAVCELAVELDERRQKLRPQGATRLHFTLALAALFGHCSEEARARLATRVEQLIAELIEGLQHEVSSSACGTALVDLATATNQKELARAPLQKILNRWFLHPLLKVEAAAQLTRLGDAQGLEYLSAMLDGRRKDTRGHAISVAGTLQIEPLYGQVVRIAQNAEDYHHDTAILSLANYKTEQARAQLERIASEHAHEELRDLARRALEHAAHSDSPLTFFHL